MPRQATKTKGKPFIPEWTLGERIRKARKHSGLTTEQLADKLGVSHGAIGYWENGGAPRDLMATVKRIAKVTSVDYIWLLTGESVVTGGYVDPAITDKISA